MNPIRIIIHEIVNGFKSSKWLPLLTAYAVFSSIIGPGIHYPMLHLPFIALGLIMVIFNGVKIELTAVLLLLYLPMNLLITEPDAIFNPWIRLALFSVVFIFVSPLLYGRYVGEYRKKILCGALFICSILGLGSFFCYLLGINYMRNQVDGSAISDYAMSSGGFGGLLFHSISLGMVSGLGMLYLLFRALNQGKKDRIWYFAAIVVLAITILISASRNALLSAITGMIVMIYQLNRKKGNFLRVMIVVLLLGMLTYPLWEGFTTGIELKNVNQSELGTYGSRTDKWNARIAEFSSSPIYGIGFSSVDPRLDVVGIGGGVEPGSSWLCIMSMTGIVGLILVLWILIKPFQYLKSHPTPYNSLLLGLMVFICTHMISEGYIFAGGSALCFMAWLIFGCCNDARYSDLK